MFGSILAAHTAGMYETFVHKKIKVGDYEIDLSMAGEGVPLLLLHGFPETKLAWHAIADHLAGKYTIILPDLPGYGDSTGPAPDNGHKHYTKRVMGDVLLQVMLELDFEQFALGGHDRGARVAYRMALDHPQSITKLVLLNIVPTLEMMEQLDYEGAIKMENWLFLAQPAPVPETMIQANPAFYLNHVFDSWSTKPTMISPEIRATYLRYFKKPEVINAICAEYRASILDGEYDREDRKHKRKIQCPTHVLWSQNDFPDETDSPLKVWKKWAKKVSGKGLDCGHFLMEEMPIPVLHEISSFLR